MSDATYQLNIYRKQGGDALIVDDGGYIAVPVVSETTAANASNFGMSILKATGGTVKTYGLDTPEQGCVKHIQAVVAAATGFICVGASGITINYNGTAEQYLKFAGDGGVTLVADTTASYVVVAEASTGSIATSTSGTS